MIKVGQIYCHKHGRRHITLCLTKIMPNRCCYIIENNGVANSRLVSDFKNYTFVAEYPTWQEAVNSPEFNEVEDIFRGKILHYDLRKLDDGKQI